MRLFTASNFITLGNLLSGCLGIVAVLSEENLQKAGILVGVALLLDFCDGFIARLLGESSELGKQLDSLADVVSFGVLPGLMLWSLLQDNSVLPQPLSYLAWLIPLFSALRLAKFNIDTRQSMSFIGLPTPANGMVIASFPFLINGWAWTSELLTHTWFLPIYIVLFSYLLVSEIPLPALKFKNYSWKDNKFTYTLLVGSVLSLISIQLLAIPLIVFFYISYSLWMYFRKS